MEIFKTFKKPKDVLILLGLILLAGAVFWGIWNYYYRLLPQYVLIITKEPVYHSNKELKLAIKNILPNNICFSSCYPYYIEAKLGKWVTYDYYEYCPHPDLIESCIKPDYAKFYLITLPDLDPGLHRIRVPVTISGKAGQEFREDRVYYSNDFIIK